MDTPKPMEADICYKLECAITKNGSRNKVIRNLETMYAKKKSSGARIDYVYQLMTQHNLFPDVTKMEDKKSDAKAVEFRNMGNTYYTSKPPQFLQALATYNKSICYAVSPENIGIAIANRSAVLFTMQMYPECLESIRMAREIGVPEKVGVKLAAREAVCRAKIENMPPKEIFVAKIGMPVNEKIPFMAKCLKLNENAKYGKHIVTDEDIPAGTFIAIDEPYCKVVANSDKYLRCATCLLEVPHLLLPCDNCTHTMFCSNACKEKAGKDFHTIECPIIGALFEIFDESLLLVFRLCIRGLLAFPDAETMASRLPEIYKEQKTIFNFNWNEELTPEDLLTPTCTLPLFENKVKNIARDTLEGLDKYVWCCLTYNLLKSTIGCPRYMTTNAAEDVVKDFVYRNVLNTATNATGYITTHNSGTSNIPSRYGCSMRTLCNLVTRSCCPNTVSIIMGSAFGVITTKKIAAGEKLEHVAGGTGNEHYTQKSKIDRQKDVLAQFGSLCECAACIGDYPEIEDIPFPLDIPEFIPTIRFAGFFDKCFCSLLVSNNKMSSEMARAYVQNYGHIHYPNKYVCAAETEILMSAALLYGGISLRLRNDFPNRCPKCKDRQ